MRKWNSAVFTIFVLLGCVWATLLSRFPAIRDELGFSLTDMSLIVLFASAGSLVGLFSAGRTVSFFGTKRALFIWLTIMTVALPIATLILYNGMIIASYPVFMMLGFGFGTADVAVNVNGAAAERSLGKSRLSLFHSGFSIGSVTALGIGALAETFSLNVLVHFVIVCAALLATAYIALPSIQSETVLDEALAPAAQDGSPRNPLAGRSPYTDPRVILLGIIALSGSFAEGIATDWLPLGLVDGYGISNDAGVLILAVFYVGGMTMRLTGDKLIDRFGRTGVLRVSLTVGAIGIALVAFSPVISLAVVGALLWGIGAALPFPVGISAAGDKRETATRDVAAVSAIAYAAFLLGPVSIGYLGEQIGLRLAFLLVVVIQVVAWVLSSAAKPPKPEDTLSS